MRNLMENKKQMIEGQQSDEREELLYERDQYDM